VIMQKATSGSAFARYSILQSLYAYILELRSLSYLTKARNIALNVDYVTCDSVIKWNCARQTTDKLKRLSFNFPSMIHFKY
jgi:hypothetical protein